MTAPRAAHRPDAVGNPTGADAVADVARCAPPSGPGAARRPDALGNPPGAEAADLVARCAPPGGPGAACRPDAVGNPTEAEAGDLGPDPMPTADRLAEAARKLAAADALSLHQVSTHEAAHATIGAALGLRVAAVTLVPSGLARAAVTFADRGDGTPDGTRRWMVAVAAGEVGQRMLAPDDLPDDDKPMGASADRALVIGGARELHGLLADPDTIEAEVALANRRAAQLVWLHAATILDLAQRLIEFQGVLDRIPRWAADDDPDCERMTEMGMLDAFRSKAAADQGTRAAERGKLWARMRELLRKADGDKEAGRELADVARRLGIDPRRVELLHAVMAKCTEYEALEAKGRAAADELAELEKARPALAEAYGKALHAWREFERKSDALAAAAGNAQAAALAIETLANQFPDLLKGDEEATPAPAPPFGPIREAAQRLGIPLRTADDARRERQDQEQRAAMIA